MELPADFLSLGRGSVIFNFSLIKQQQITMVRSDLANLKPETFLYYFPKNQHSSLLKKSKSMTLHYVFNFSLIKQQNKVIRTYDYKTKRGKHILVDDPKVF